MFSILLIAIGIAVLVVGKRLAVLGAAVGALLGVTLLRWIPGSSGPLIAFGVPIGLAVLGFFVAGFAKGIVNIVLIVLGALAGVAITLAVLRPVRHQYRSFRLAVGAGRWCDWHRRCDALQGLGADRSGRLDRRAAGDTRGLADWLPFLAGAAGTLLVLVLAGASIAYQGGLFGKRKA